MRLKPRHAQGCKAVSNTYECCSIAIVRLRSSPRRVTVWSATGVGGAQNGGARLPLAVPRHTAVAAIYTEQAQELEQERAQGPSSHLVTGGRLGSSGSGRRLLPQERLPLTSAKQIVLVRHGQTTWNLEGRIQGSTNKAELTEAGKRQVRLQHLQGMHIASRCRTPCTGCASPVHASNYRGCVCMTAVP